MSVVDVREDGRKVMSAHGGQRQSRLRVTDEFPDVLVVGGNQLSSDPRGPEGVAESMVLNQQEDMMEKDVVCGMQVDPAKAAGKSEHNGRAYYFCSPGCKAKFDANPQQYTK
jgi:Cu+-exporting ATPase